MFKRLSMWASIAVVLLLSMISVLPISAQATVSQVAQTCSSFSAQGSTDQPYITVEVWSYIGSGPNYIDHVYVTLPVNPDGSFNVNFAFPEQPAGTIINYWLWASLTSSLGSWDGQAWYESGEVACTAAFSGPGIPAGFALRTITCDVAVYNLPAGVPVSGATIRSGQTWFINPVSVQGSDGQSWTEIFAGGFTNGFIPTSCVGGGV